MHWATAKWCKAGCLSNPSEILLVVRFAIDTLPLAKATIIICLSLFGILPLLKYSFGEV